MDMVNRPLRGHKKGPVSLQLTRPVTPSSEKELKNV